MGDARLYGFSDLPGDLCLKEIAAFYTCSDVEGCSVSRAQQPEGAASLGSKFRPHDGTS